MQRPSLSVDGAPRVDTSLCAAHPPQTFPLYCAALIKQQGAGSGGSDSAVVKIYSVKEDAAFVAASRRFEEAMASQGFRGFCQEKEASATSAHERRVWQFMQVIFEKNARNQLLAHLGFDGESVAR